ncbi:Sterol uptake control protein 2 [Colletotrichum shisoi]|uniref:Sterol uptake control protein 2 n=1 Tax=Colletotrichum shisoi TaxID=2078593 RepID=A0A5Q4BZR8_9PEZI|nr:Sterol uptake control protein 2 [Colletotrichum shisoi]
MATRRSHTKSRTGCRDCKRRKVKCDEAYPSCLNCTRHGIPCSLSSSSGDVSSSAPPQRSSHTPSASGQSPEVLNHFLDVVFHRSRAVSQAPTIELWGHGLELMHHYSLHTANTMSSKPEMQHVWRVAIPEIGYECPFVMHGILAIAALHKAYLLPPERDTYLDLATSHQTAGLEGFRAVLHKLDDSNWESVFCFASITSLHVSFHPVRKSTDHDAELLPDITALFVFVRGIRAILEPYHGGLSRTRLGPMAQGSWVIDPGDTKNPSLRHSPLPRDTFDALRRLSAFFEETLPDGTRSGYFTAVRELEKSARLMAHAGTNLEVGMAVFWPYVISDAVMADIQSMNPYAMVLLSHFSLCRPAARDGADVLVPPRLVGEADGRRRPAAGRAPGAFRGGEVAQGTDIRVVWSMLSRLMVN